MAVKNRGQVRAQARLFARDTSTVKPVVDDTEYNLFIEDAYQFVHRLLGERRQSLTSDVSGLSEVGAVALFTSSMSNIERILEVRQTTSGTDTIGPPIGWEPMHEMFTRLMQGAPQSDDPFVAYSCARLESGMWVVLLDHQTNGQFYLAIDAEVEPAELAADATVLDLRPHEADFVARLAAAQACPIIGHPPAYCAELIKPLPDVLKESLVLNAQSFPGTPKLITPGG